MTTVSAVSSPAFITPTRRACFKRNSSPSPLAQQGDIRAFEKLVEFFQDAVFGAAYAIAQNFHDAEEIAQEAFVLAYQELPRLREPEKFPGWLRQLTRAACGRYLRSRKAACQDISAALDVPADSPGQDVVVETRELREHILREINALSEKNRLVTVLYFIDGYSHKEISDFLEAPVSTVKNRLVRVIEPYHMKIRRRGRYLLWQVNGQTIGEVQLADDELCLTERLYLVNHGKGSGAVYKNVVIRSHILEVDPSWPDAGPEENME